MERFIGIDIGGTNIAAGVIDKEGKIYFSGSTKTPTESPQAIADACFELCNKMLKDNGLTFSDITLIGADAPGDVKDGVIAGCPNLPLSRVDLSKILSDRFGTKITVCNDANAAAMAEAKLGAGRGYGIVAMVTIGTGVGGGIAINGDIIEGASGAAAEVGHTVIVMGGKQCACGVKGCFEAYCSARAFTAMANEQMQAHPESLMNTLAYKGHISAPKVFEAIKKKDKTATDVLNSYAEYFAAGLISGVICPIQPDIICIGGGMSSQGETLLQPIRKWLDNYSVYKESTKPTKLVPARFAGDAGMIGSVLYAIQKSN